MPKGEGNELACYNSLLLYAASLIGSRPTILPEDVVQSAYLSYYSVPNKSAIKTPCAWLRRVVRNEAIDQARRLTQVTSTDSLASLPSTEQALILDEAIRNLPNQQATAFMLVRIDGFSQREAAHRMGISQGAVSRLVDRASEQLAVTAGGKNA